MSPRLLPPTWATHVSKTAASYMGLILLLTIVASVASSIFNEVFLSGDIDHMYQILPVKGTILFLAVGSPTFISLTLTLLYMASFKGVVKQRTYRTLRRAVALLSVLYLLAVGGTCAMDTIYCKDIYSQGLSYFQDQMDNGSWADEYWQTFFRLRALTTLATVQLLCVTLTLVVFRRRYRERIRISSQPFEPKTSISGEIVTGGITLAPNLSPNESGVLSTSARSSHKTELKTKAKATKMSLLPWVYAMYCVSYILLSTLSMLRMKQQYRYFLVPANLIEGACLSVIMFPFGSK
ncbi:hypothetical protein KIPB_007501 [Kipferlia bialata]|uniref:Uncharacterized protein n=1 Tax=Kipferlia bialata TaxID=797122 RepID=A0A9K3CYN3_9EUKA|nr:hypothetical protein KIPB_007501 [Kipferlia bialata]|eukprot:g7501.t1